MAVSVAVLWCGCSASESIPRPISAHTRMPCPSSHGGNQPIRYVRTAPDPESGDVFSDILRRSIP